MPADPPVTREPPLACRALRPADAGAVARVVERAADRELGGAPRRAASAAGVALWSATLRQPTTWGFIATCEGGVVGVVAGTAPPAPGAPAELTTLAVEPSWWGRGVARRLLAAAHRHLAARGRRQARLWVHEGNRRARHRYERSGWRLTGERTVQRSTGRRAVRYHLDL